MSLDVYLSGPPKEVECECSSCGHKHKATNTDLLFDTNITHNLNKMAEAAGIYLCVWRPEETGITHARQIVEPLRKGIELLKASPEFFKKFDAPNGWGTYDDFVPWLERYLAACEEYPDASVRVSR